MSTYRIIFTGLFVVLTTGCGGFVKKASLTAAAGYDLVEKSKFEAQLESGDLNLDSTMQTVLGASYYIEHSSLEVSLSLTRHSPVAEAIDDDLNIESQLWGLDYYFDGMYEDETAFIGLATGNTRIAVGGDDPTDRALSWRLRGGYQWRLRSLLAAYVYGYYLKTGTVSIGQFYYFGSSADVVYESLGVSAGVRVFTM